MVAYIGYNKGRIIELPLFYYKVSRQVLGNGYLYYCIKASDFEALDNLLYRAL